MSNSSSVSNLRQYRFKKNALTTEGKDGTSSSSNNVELAPGRKRILNACDSSSDDAASPQQPAIKRKPETLTVKEKEIQLITLKKMEPDFDTMLCQDALVRCNWDANVAAIYMRQNCTKTSRYSWKTHKAHEIVDSKNISTAVKESAPAAPAAAEDGGGLGTSETSNQSSDTFKVQNGNAVKSLFQPMVTAKKKARRRDNSDDDLSDNDGGDDQENPTERVFESDDEDSDTEVVYEMTRDRKGVFKFFNEATSNELQMVKTCTAKKVDTILELRQFTDWNDLIRKLQNHKNLSTDILNYAQEFLNRRNNMMKIMKKCDKIVRKLDAAFADDSSVLTEQPAILNSKMKLANYQMAGLNWLTVMHREGMNGILADEMGLGKTIQVIAFLGYLKETGQSYGTHLIVVPSSTLDNWQNELTTWCPSLVVEKYYGSATERRALRIKYAKSIAGIDVILTTYNMVQSTPEERKMFRVTKMQYVIFDEAHMLKNMTTQRYAYLFRISAERRLLLTGTPLQNNLLELMSLLCFVMPSLFANNTEDIKNLFQKNNKIKGEEEISTFEQTQIDKAKKIMKPFILRRLKLDVLDSLPTKHEVVVKPPMSQRQKIKYNEMVEHYSNDAGEVQATAEVPIMTIMMDLRKLANHPLMLRYYYTDEKVKQIAKILSTHPLYKKNPHPQYIFEELAILSDFQLLQTMERFDISAGMEIPDSLVVDSGKFQHLDYLLPKLKNENHRVLIFSQFTMMLDIMERYLDLRNYSFLRIDGQTPVPERQDVINKFNGNNDIFVFLLSTRAGGLGINLTAADTAIIHDIDFNPYNDKQAEDRCHRMGQTRPVTIYRFVSEGTLEEGMHIIAQEKLNLEKEVTGEGGDITKDQKCMVRLLAMTLGINEEKAEIILSPQKNAMALTNDDNRNAADDPDDDY